MPLFDLFKSPPPSPSGTEAPEGAVGGTAAGAAANVPQTQRPMFTSAPGTLGGNTGAKEKKKDAQLRARMEEAARMAEQQTRTFSVTFGSREEKEQFESSLNEMSANVRKAKKLKLQRKIAEQRAQASIREIYRLAAIEPDTWTLENGARMKALVAELSQEKEDIEAIHNKCIECLTETMTEEDKVLEEDQIWVDIREKIRGALSQAQGHLETVAAADQESEQSSSEQDGPAAGATAAVPAIDPTMQLLLQQMVQNNTNLMATTKIAAQLHERAPLEVGTFNGQKEEDYHAFKEQFNALYDAKGYTDKAVFTCLQKHLGGNAKITIEGLRCEDGALALAWDLLDKKYGSRNTLLRSMQATLASLPNNPPEHHTRTIRKSLDRLAVLQRRLEAMDNDGNFALMGEWEKKFPISFRQKWAEKTESGAKDIDSAKDFIEVMEQKMRILEVTEQIQEKKEVQKQSVLHSKPQTSTAPKPIGMGQAPKPSGLGQTPKPSSSGQTSKQPTAAALQAQKSQKK